MMELVAMVEEVEKRKSNFKIMPVFLHTSLKEFDDQVNCTRWLSCWHELVVGNPERVKIEKWRVALNYLRFINSLVYNGLGELKFQKVIVDAICAIVPPEIRLEDSHIQGRSCLCKVIWDKIDMQQKNNIHGVYVVGLYGMGGIGKTSICKVLWNEFFTEFSGRVCHAELKRGSKEELLREVMKRLSDKSSEVLNGFNVDQNSKCTRCDEKVGEAKVKIVVGRLGDGINTSIGTHDLWRAFCVAETKSRKLRCRRWIYDAEKRSELVENSPSGTCWENVVRMAFLNCELINLERVNFALFSNVTVLKIDTVGLKSKMLVLDLSGLIHLKSLEVLGNNLHFLVLQGLSRDLIFLSSNGSYWLSPETVAGSSPQLVEQIGCLKELQCLKLHYYGGDKLPNMRSLVSMRVAIFSQCNNVVTLTGLSSELTNLRVLDLRGCEQLRSCPGVGDLVVLEELNFQGCKKLESLPNLRKLGNLRKLNIGCCSLINELSGLGDLEALEDLSTIDCGKLSTLPDMRKLRNLQVLDISCCGLEAVAGLEGLLSLRELEANFREAQVDLSNVRLLTKLQDLSIIGWSLAGLIALFNLTMLQNLHISSCWGVDELPDFWSLIRLHTLTIEDCGFRDVSGLINLNALVNLSIYDCNNLERLPGLQRLTRLKSLYIDGSVMLRGWDGTLGNIALSSCWLDRFDLLDSQRLFGSGDLLLSNRRLLDFTSHGALSQLQSLACWDLPLWELPDLSNFPRLETLHLGSCQRLRRLPIREPMYTLTELTVSTCSFLATLPDLCNFPALRSLHVWECDGITTLSSGGPLTALTELCMRSCYTLQTLPNLGMFTALKKIELSRCSELTTLSSSVPNLPALNWLSVRECRRLSRDDLDQLRALCPQFCEVDYDALHEDVQETKRSRISG